jgi:adenosylcobinamide-GDP ribazoletransferase
MFYTRIPVPADLEYNPTLLNRSRMYFPAVGLLVGLLSAGAYWLSLILWSPSIAVLLSLVFSIWITGAFHEDGLADTTDGLGGGWSKERILEIMKDSRIGTFGTIALLLNLGLKALCGVSIASAGALEAGLRWPDAERTGWWNGPIQYGFLLIYAHTASRFLASSVIEMQSYVQDPEQSKIKPIASRRLGPLAQAVGIATLSMSALFLIDRPFWILGFFPAMAILFWIIRKLEHWIGGYTGDTLGAAQQTTETALYLFAAMPWTTGAILNHL